MSVIKNDIIGGRLLSLNDDKFHAGDRLAISVGDHDSEIFNSGVEYGTTSMTQRFNAMNPKTNKSIEGTLVFKITITNKSVENCSLKAILIE